MFRMYGKRTVRIPAGEYHLKLNLPEDLPESRYNQVVKSFEEKLKALDKELRDLTRDCKGEVDSDLIWYDWEKR